MIAALIGVLLAVVLHASFLAFGGLLLPEAREDHGTLREVELVSTAEVEAEEEETEDETQAEPTEELIELEEEAAPDSEEVIRSLELDAAAATPALEAASLAAIQDALRGIGGSDMGFGDAMTFSSGGRIGGTGKPGALADELESAFSLAEIDQKPRAVFQSAPLFPSEMRGKKVEGVVTVIFVVDSGGKVADPRVEKSSHPAFERPALDAVRQWKFEPGVKGGQRVPCKMRVPIRFQPS